MGYSLQLSTEGVLGIEGDTGLLAFFFFFLKCDFCQMSLLREVDLKFECALDLEDLLKHRWLAPESF